jgi:uncharacterized protein YjgD (DUF1641 family)
MAQAIHKIAEMGQTPEALRSEALEALEGALADNAEAVVQYLQLVRQLHDKGMLGAANAILQQGTSILEILVAQANKPEYAGGIKNLIVMGEVLGKVDMKMLTGLLMSVAEAKDRVNRGEAQEVHGMFHMIRSLSDPEVKAGISFMFEVLRTLGRDVHES